MGKLSEEGVRSVLDEGFDVTTSDGERLLLHGAKQNVVQSALSPGQYPPVQFIAASGRNYSAPTPPVAPAVRPSPQSACTTTAIITGLMP